MKKNKGIGGHQSSNSKTDEWITPLDILHNLGAFDLDPCSPVQRPWDTAKQHYTIEDNGLLLPWNGRVWLNPPYSELDEWMAKMAQHREGIALIFARTDRYAFHDHIFPVADSLFFIQRRIHFCTVAGIKAKDDCGAPSVLIAYGEQNVDALEDCGLRGKHVYLNSVPMVVVAMHKSWRAIVTVALTRINGEAPLQRVYDLVAQIAPDRVAKNKHYREKIRQQLQTHFPRVKKGVYMINLEEAA